MDYLFINRCLNTYNTSFVIWGQIFIDSLYTSRRPTLVTYSPPAPGLYLHPHTLQTQKITSLTCDKAPFAGHYRGNSTFTHTRLQCLTSLNENNSSWLNLSLTQRHWRVYIVASNISASSAQNQRIISATSAQHQPMSCGIVAYICESLYSLEHFASSRPALVYGRKVCILDG